MRRGGTPGTARTYKLMERAMVIPGGNDVLLNIFPGGDRIEAVKSQ